MDIPTHFVVRIPLVVQVSAVLIVDPNLIPGRPVDYVPEVGTKIIYLRIVVDAFNYRSRTNRT